MDEGANFLVSIRVGEHSAEVNGPLKLWKLFFAVAFVFEATRDLQPVTKVEECTPVVVDATTWRHSARRAMDPQRDRFARRIDSRVLRVELEPNAHVLWRLHQLGDELGDDSD